MLAALLLNLGGAANVLLLAGAEARFQDSEVSVRLELLDQQWYEPQGRAGSPVRFEQILSADVYTAGCAATFTGGDVTVAAEKHATAEAGSAVCEFRQATVQVAVGSVVEAGSAACSFRQAEVAVTAGVEAVVPVSAHYEDFAGGSPVVVRTYAAPEVFSVALEAPAAEVRVTAVQNPSAEELVALIQMVRRRRAA